jgi:hypothetical protein
MIIVDSKSVKISDKLKSAQKIADKLNSATRYELRAFKQLVANKKYKIISFCRKETRFGEKLLLTLTPLEDEKKEEPERFNVFLSDKYMKMEQEFKEMAKFDDVYFCLILEEIVKYNGLDIANLRFEPTSVDGNLSNE